MLLSKKKVQIFVYLSALFVIIMHAASLMFSLYWRFRWLDNVMHFAGGVWLSSLAVWLMFFSGERTQFVVPNKLVVLILIVAVTALGGVLWEFFEFFVDIVLNSRGYESFMQPTVSDTMSDFAFDLLGGLVGGVILLRMISKKEELG